MAELQTKSGEELKVNTIAAFASFTPFYLLLALKQRFSLDNLHLTLIQLVVFFTFRTCAGFPLWKRRIAHGAVTEKVKVEEATQTGAAVAVRSRKKKGKSKGRHHAIFNGNILDSNLRQFLDVICPVHSGLLKNSTPSDFEPIALKDWVIFHTSEDGDLVVAHHPQQTSLYAVCAKFRGLSFIKLVEALRTVERRTEWDSMCEEGEIVEEVRDGDGRHGSVSYLKMKGMAIVKAKDMCVLSSLCTLPKDAPPVAPFPDSLPEDSPPEVPLRLVCASSSTEHPSKPPVRTHNRMSLKISGFVAESDGFGNSSLVQITDLSGLGNWVPASITKAVTTKMIPASLKKLGEMAHSLDLEEIKQDRGDDWLPPELGSWPREGEVGDEDGDEEEEDEELEDISKLPPGLSKNLRLLIDQLAKVTQRLEGIESASLRISSKANSDKSTLDVMKNDAMLLLSNPWSVLAMTGAAGGAFALMRTIRERRRTVW